MTTRPLLPRLLLLILAIAIATSSATAGNRQDMMVRVYFENKVQRLELLRMGLDIAYVGDDYLDVVTDSTELKLLQSKRHQTEVVHPSLSKFYRNRISAKENLTMGGYMTLAEINDYLDSLIVDHPNLVSAKQHIGYTLEGRDTWAIKISDNPNVDEDETEVLYYAATHAREVITPLVLIHFIDYLTDNYESLPDVKSLVDERELYFVLAVNPDGYYHNEVIEPFGGGMWRKNMRPMGVDTGVDLNRNYDYMWGYDDYGSSPNPGGTTYRGPSAFSEPESQNMRDFIESRNFIITVNYHAYGNLVIWPWGYDYLYCPDEGLFSQIGDSIVAFNSYDPGPLWTLYTVNGGSDDWAYAEQTTKNKCLALCLEVGDAYDQFWPAPSRIPTLVEENLQPNLFLARIASQILTLAPPMAPWVSLSPRVDSVEYTVHWLHIDSTNPAVSYELFEYKPVTLGTDSANSLDIWTNNNFVVSSGMSHSGATSFHSDSGNSLTNYMQSILPLSVEDGDTLRFWAYYSIEENWDYAYVEVSTDGQTFSPIQGNISNLRNPNGSNRGFGITGSPGEWVEGLFDLSDFDGQDILIRFSYNTDGSVVDTGIFIDDIFPLMTFEQENLISSALTDTFYTFSNESTGDHYYRVRAKDAQDQWSEFSMPAGTNVVGFVAGDIDLDGISSSVADMVLFDLYLLQGMDAFTVDVAAQIAQTDINCDGLNLTAADMTMLNQVLLGLDEPCYGGTFFVAEPPASSRDGDKSLTTTGQSSSLKSTEELSFAVGLETISPPDSDTARVNIVMTAGNAGIIGFQFHLEYDTTGFELVNITLGSDVAGWNSFGHTEEITSTTALLKIVGVAWTNGDPPSAGDIDPQPLPEDLVQLTYVFKDPTDTLSRDISFVWDRCGDNVIAIGGFADTTADSDMILNVLALSNNVFSADAVNITGVKPRLGGKSGYCDNGYLGIPPVGVIDFSSGRAAYVPPCCVGLTGNVDCDPEGVVDIGDVTALITHLFINLKPLCCTEQGNVDGLFPMLVDIGDLTALIASLFISLTPPPACP